MGGTPGAGPLEVSQIAPKLPPNAAAKGVTGRYDRGASTAFSPHGKGRRVKGWHMARPACTVLHTEGRRFDSCIAHTPPTA